MNPIRSLYLPCYDASLTLERSAMYHKTPYVIMGELHGVRYPERFYASEQEAHEYLDRVEAERCGRKETNKMTETTKERIENARKRLDIAEKWELPTMDPNFFAIVELADEVKKLGDMNTSLGTMLNDKVAEIDKLEAELAALKEKMRWRDENVEPAPRGERVLVYCIDYDASDGVHDTEMEHMYCPDGELAYPYTWWRPLDLPEGNNA